MLWPASWTVGRAQWIAACQLCTLLCRCGAFPLSIGSKGLRKSISSPSTAPTLNGGLPLFFSMLYCPVHFVVSRESAAMNAILQSGLGPASLEVSREVLSSQAQDTKIHLATWWCLRCSLLQQEVIRRTLRTGGALLDAGLLHYYCGSSPFRQVHKCCLVEE